MLIALALGFAASCDALMDQTDEANKLVGEATALIDQSNKIVLKSNDLFTELFGANLSQADDAEKYKRDNKAKFDELIAASGEIEKSSNEIIGKLEQASKLKLNQIYKQYLELKLQEHQKRLEGEKLTVPFIKSFLEIKDVEKMNELIEEYDKQTAAVEKESADLKQKADQIVKDNPNLIK